MKIVIKKIVRRIKNRINDFVTRGYTKKHKEEGLVLVEDPIEYHNRGVDYLEVGDYDKALDMFIEECKHAQWCYIGHHYVGKTLHLMGGYDAKARECYERALERLRGWTKEYPEKKAELAEDEEEILSDLKKLAKRKNAKTV